MSADLQQPKRNRGQAVDSVPYVNAWKTVQALGFGTVSDVATASIDGERATTMTVAFTRNVVGLPDCNAATAAPTDCWGIIAGQSLRLAVVDQGKRTPVTLLYEFWNSDNPNGESVASEFDTWLASVRFTE